MINLDRTRSSLASYKEQVGELPKVEGSTTFALERALAGARDGTYYALADACDDMGHDRPAGLSALKMVAPSYSAKPAEQDEPSSIRVQPFVPSEQRKFIAAHQRNVGLYERIIDDLSAQPTP